MYGQIEATQRLQSRCRRLRADSLDGAGQPCIHCAVTPGESIAPGDCPSVPWGRQRANDRHACAPEAAGLDFLRHDSAGEAGIAECLPDSRDGKGAQTAQGELVRVDVAEPGQVGWVRPGSGSGVCAQRVSENAALTPGDGVEERQIAPPDGVETLPPTPGDGAIEAIFRSLSTPPDGDPLDTPSALGISTVQPEKLRATRMIVRPMAGDVARWKRLTQRDYLLYLVGAIQRVTFKGTRIADARDVLHNLNGIGGQW